MNLCGPRVHSSDTFFLKATCKTNRQEADRQEHKGLRQRGWDRWTFKEAVCVRSVCLLSLKPLTRSQLPSEHKNPAWCPPTARSLKPHQLTFLPPDRIKLQLCQNRSTPGPLWTPPLLSRCQETPLTTKNGRVWGALGCVWFECWLRAGGQRVGDASRVEPASLSNTTF